MKIIKFLAIVAFASMLTVSCSSDDSSPIEQIEKTQKELEAKFPLIGTFEYTHGAVKIPYIFASNSLIVKSSTMQGEDTEQTVVKAFQNLAGDVYKVVIKDVKTAEYNAFFLRSITAESVEINMDYHFATEKEAIDSKYPDPKEGVGVGHTTFGWLKLIKASIASVNLPISGKYIFDGTADGGGVYTYTFSNDKISFDAAGAYDMKVLNYNATTKKILLEGLDTKAGIYYVAQLQDITDRSVKIARDTKNPVAGANPKAEAEALFNSSENVAGRFTEYFKEEAILPVQGIYEFDGTAQGGGTYTYTFSNEKVSFNSGTPYSMKVLAYNKTLNTLLLEGIDASVQGVYYAIKLTDVTATSVAITRDTFKESATVTNPKEAATATFNGTTPFTGRATTYQKK